MPKLELGQQFAVRTLKSLGESCAKRVALRRPAFGYIGWTIAKNLGDDVMLEAARRLLEPEPVEIFRGARRERLLCKLGLSGPRKFRHVFLGGGTLVNNGYVSIVRSALDMGLELSALGTGVGSSGFNEVLEAAPMEWAELLRRFKHVGVRGPRSAAKLRKLGVSNATVVGDLALALTPTRRLGAEHGSHFLVNVAEPAHSDLEYPRELVRRELANAVRCASRGGLTPIPVAFCKDDETPTLAVMSEAGFAGDKIARPSNSSEFFAIANGARMMIGVRLHSFVLAAACGVAPIGVSYREKGKDFAESMGLERWMVSTHPLREGALTHATLALTESGRVLEVGQVAYSNALEYQRILVGFTEWCRKLDNPELLSPAIHCTRRMKEF